jgi:hypothetical protein
MALDLANLTPEDLIALKARLDGLTDVSGRSPARPRQLHDLTLLPTADDPRPTFFWSAEPPRNAGDLRKTTPFPRLMWHSETGVEIAVMSAASQATATAAGYLEYPPFDAVEDPMDVLAAQIDALSEQDRAALIESQRQDRINALRSQLAAMPEEKLAALLAKAEPKKAKKAS